MESKSPNPARFAPLIIVAIVFTVALSVFGSLYCSMEEEKRLLRSGEPAVAEILDMVDTGNRYNLSPEIEFTLLVTPSDGAPYEGLSTAVLDAVEQQNYRVGTTLDVRYSSADPQQIAIVGIARPGEAPPGEAERLLDAGVES